MSSDESKTDLPDLVNWPDWEAWRTGETVEGREVIVVVPADLAPQPPTEVRGDPPTIEFADAAKPGACGARPPGGADRGHTCLGCWLPKGHTTPHRTRCCAIKWANRGG